MSSVFDLLYREYCRARLAEMRKQLLIPIASDEILMPRSNGGDSIVPVDRGDGWGDAPATKEAQSVR